MLPDYYSILAVRPDASPEEIRAAYRRLAKRLHPDVGGESVTFHAVQEAYDALSDPAGRRAYDAQRSRELRSPRPVRVMSREEPMGYSNPKSPEPLIPSEPLLPRRAAVPRVSGSLDDFDRLFREFDEFFERLEVQFLRPSWGRNE